METQPLAHLRETFILRIWRDSDPNSQWRCQLQQVSDGEVLAFETVGAAFEYVEEHLARLETRSNSRLGLR
jgi:hypothetical protein